MGSADVGEWWRYVFQIEGERFYTCVDVILQSYTHMYHIKPCSHTVKIRGGGLFFGRSIVFFPKKNQDKSEILKNQEKTGIF